MLDAWTEINWLAVLMATLACSLLGGVWFTVLFGKAYASALGRAHGPTQKPAPLFLLGPLVCSLLTVVTSAVLLRALSVGSLAEALAFGALVGLGYVVATMVNTAINPNFPRPFSYSLVSGPYFFLGSLVTSLILFAMG